MKVKYFDLENKRVFITGGGSGIGASIVEHFCEQKSEVYFIDINEEASNKLVEDCKNKKLSIPNFIKCDLLNIKHDNKVIEVVDNGGIVKYKVVIGPFKDIDNLLRILNDDTFDKYEDLSIFLM